MCGIFGIINRRPKKFDYKTFCTLGVVNDSRGGDSCGVFIDGKVEYGVSKEKLFTDFFYGSKLINEKRDSDISIALGHCRKASVGVISEKTAQPVVLKDKDGNIRFVMVHNGTIYNYQELAKKYLGNVDITGLTDSQVMARIFYYKGYDVLSEYIGGSVFVITDYRQPEPQTLMFKGSSKMYSYSKGPTEERPLFLTINEGNVVFSSIEIYLYTLCPGLPVYTLSANTLCQVGNGDDDKVTIIKQYPRTNATQSRPIETVSVPGYSKTSSGSTQSTSSTAGSNFSSYLMENAETNRYSLKSALPHGRFVVTNVGRVLGKDENNKYSKSYEIYFFSGIALRGGLKSFNALTYLQKKTGLKSGEFAKKFENVVRYYSIDRLFWKGDKLMKAVNFFECVEYTGKFQMIGTTKTREFRNGSDARITEYTGSYDKPFEKLSESIECNNLNKICKRCMSLMK